MLKDVTEDDLISQLVPLLPKARNVMVPSGDDSAVLAPSGAVAVSTDLLVEDRHFKRAWSTGKDVGFRAAMQNLADAVAMGAQPVSLVVGMSLPEDLESEWVLDFARGLAEACEPWGVGVDGGDLVSGEHIVISVTVLGDMKDRTPIERKTVQPGDLVIHAGNLGHGIAGYSLLEAGHSRDDSSVGALIDDFLRPKPPIDVALAAARSGSLHAMMDVSDGLIRDGRRMAKASRVWIDFDQKAVEKKIGPLAVAAGRLGVNRRDWLFLGGEDHGFLATIAADTPVPEGFIVIGKVRGASQHGRLTISGKEVPPNIGWDSFSPNVEGSLFSGGGGDPMAAGGVTVI